MARRSAFKERKTEVSLPPAESKAKRDRAWERKHKITGYRGIPEELHAELTQIADKLGVNVGDVARAFLTHGLEAYQAGRLKLEARPSRGKLTLFQK